MNPALVGGSGSGLGVRPHGVNGVISGDIYTGLYLPGLDQDQGDSDDIDHGCDPDGSAGAQHHILAGSLRMCATVTPLCSPSLKV